MPAVRAIVRDARATATGSRLWSRDRDSVPFQMREAPSEGLRCSAERWDSQRPLTVSGLSRPCSSPKPFAAAAHVPEGDGRSARAAAARRDGAGAHGRDRADGRSAAPAAGVRLHPARRDHGPVDAGDRRARIRAHADPEAARAVPRLAGRGDEPAAAGAGRRHAITPARRRPGSRACRRSAPPGPTSRSA